MNFQQPPKSEPADAKLVDVVISDQNTALNMMVSFLNLAQKRGTYTIDEAAKIWECIKMFQQDTNQGPRI
jgi:hypothetical protein